MVFKQKFDENFEVIIVDNYSDDNTLKIVKSFNVKKIIKIKKYFPGKALNAGIKKSSGKYLVFLSSHCVPSNSYWLKNLIKPFSKYKDKLAGVYGKQLPISSTSPSDKRDLLLMFGEDEKIQKKDYFFHNANSAIPKKIWLIENFSETATNMEDRIWAKKIIKKYNLFYQPTATVFHHHGLHQNNISDRLDGTLKIFNKTDSRKVNLIPSTFNFKELSTIAIIPIDKNFLNPKEIFLLKKLLVQLKNIIPNQKIFLVSNTKNLSKKFEVNFINRYKCKILRKESLNNLLYKSLNEIEKSNEFTDFVIFASYDYINRPSNYFNNLYKFAVNNTRDFVFSAYKDYSHYWKIKDNIPILDTDSFLPRELDSNLRYRALYGLGTISSSWLIRQKKLIGGDIGLLPIDSDQFTMRLRNK